MELLHIVISNEKQMPTKDYLIDTIELDVLNNLFSDHINKDGNKVEKIHKNS